MKWITRLTELIGSDILPPINGVGFYASISIDRSEGRATAPFTTPAGIISPLSEPYIYAAYRIPVRLKLAL